MSRIRCRNKWMLILFISAGIMISSFLLIYIAGKNINYFYTPYDIFHGEKSLSLRSKSGVSFRLGGMVKRNSIYRSADGLTIAFIIYDDSAEIKVNYQGILPDLFKEGQGVVAQGTLSENNIFYATQILAKHNADYAPHTSADSENSRSYAPNTFYGRAAQ